MEEIKEEDDKEFEPQYPAKLYKKRPTPTALLSPLYDSTFIMVKMTTKYYRGIL